MDPSGKQRQVNGVLTKLKFVSGLGPVAHCLLKSPKTVSRTLPGVKETRRQMRFDTHAMRVRYGVPIFITFSPDDKHNLIMVWLSRVRWKDPVLLRDEASKLFNGKWGSSLAPAVGPLVSDDAEEVVLAVPLDCFEELVPTYEQRRQILAQDSFASVDGFKLTLLMCYEHLFGMRVCINCPGCNHEQQSAEACTDLFASNAKAERGCFGRADAAYTSIQIQKTTGSQHGQSQVFVQCVHRHTPLSEI